MTQSKPAFPSSERGGLTPDELTYLAEEWDPLEDMLVALDALKSGQTLLPHQEAFLRSLGFRIPPEGSPSRIEALVRQMSRHFAKIVARDPSELDRLEWRDMERMVAEVFDGLGFNVTLTPSTKDGGKDVILECKVDGQNKTHIIEIKHWRSSTRVGAKAVTSFLEVVARERRDGGLFLSTYGYCENAFSTLSEVDRKRLRFGDKTKIIGVCTTYTRAASGIWSRPDSLVDLLYEGTE